MQGDDVLDYELHTVTIPLTYNICSCKQTQPAVGITLLFFKTDMQVVTLVHVNIALLLSVLSLLSTLAQCC